ncbi:MAG: hypothetical protein ACFFBV_11530 [Promethearchaeota archaeon]
MLQKRNANISLDIIKSIEKSDRKVNKIPNLEYSKIKERIIETFIDGIKKNGKIDNIS